MKYTKVKKKPIPHFHNKMFCLTRMSEKLICRISSNMLVWKWCSHISPLFFSLLSADGVLLFPISSAFFAFLFLSFLLLPSTPRPPHLVTRMDAVKNKV